MKNFDDLQLFGKGSMDATLKSFGALSKTFQTIAAEATDYAKKSFEDGSAATEKLFGAKTLDKAVEVQSAYVKSAYEGFMSQAAKFGALYVDMAKEAYKPFEAQLPRAAK